MLTSYLTGMNRAAGAFVALAFAATAAFAQGGGAPSPEARQKELAAAIEAGFKAATNGPASVTLIDQGTLKLPAAYVFVPKAEGTRMMEAMGNRTNANFIGLVLPAENARWFATLDFNKAGYVKDDDAKDWKADDLLKTLKEGTAAGNEDRAKRGFPAIEVTGWIEPPAYDKAAHRLVWAANVHRTGAPADQGNSVNYNTYALGRHGYFELNMIGAPDVIRANKDSAKLLLAALEYDLGNRYEDFKPGTDAVAGYGLAALVAGAAAKKLGLFAVIGVFLLKFWKLLALGAVVLFGGVGSLFRRKGT
ncbi:MAG: DUF2167 domain-containing protein [Hyphomicrobiaceae bacterium]